MPQNAIRNENEKEIIECATEVRDAFTDAGFSVEVHELVITDGHFRFVLLGVSYELSIDEIRELEQIIRKNLDASFVEILPPRKNGYIDVLVGTVSVYEDD